MLNDSTYVSVCVIYDKTILLPFFLYFSFTNTVLRPELHHIFQKLLRCSKNKGQTDFHTCLLFKILVSLSFMLDRHFMYLKTAFACIFLALLLFIFLQINILLFVSESRLFSLATRGCSTVTHT